MRTQRIEEIMTGMNSFRKEVYHRSEILDEMLALQSEIVSLTFNDEHASTAGLRIYDVERHLEQLNEDSGHVADEALRRFMEGSKVLCNLIKAEISGNRGEFKAFRTLEYLKSQNIVLKNVELEDGDLRTELDAIVITPKCITIVEVKNTGKDVFIDETGNYYRTGEFLRWDCDMAKKMFVKETLLRNALADAGIAEVKIQGVIVFTNNRIEIQNKFSALQTCFVSQLAYIIDGFKGEHIYSDEDMLKIREAVNKAECKEYYPAEFDALQYKMDFATVMATLEDASNVKEEAAEEIPEVARVVETKETTFKHVMRAIFTSRYTRYLGSAAAGVSLAVISCVVANNTLKQ